MRAFVFISCFIALAIARPEAGYSYNAPAPIPASTYSQSALTSYQQPPSGSSYSGSSVVGASYSVGESSYSSAGSQYTGGAIDSAAGFADTSANYNSGSSFSGFTGGSPAPATTVIQKHIYVHVPPPEPESHQNHQGGIGGGVVNQKHYKIIFIKAPSAPTFSAAQLAAQQAASQEKTIVYVLVKKPEDHVDTAGNAIATPQIAPSKPEVYFIKYKTQGGATTGGQIGGGSAIVGGTHDAVSGISFEHSSSQAIGQPSPVYGPAR